jgi:hypothetical protein
VNTAAVGIDFRHESLLPALSVDLDPSARAAQSPCGPADNGLSSARTRG